MSMSTPLIKITGKGCVLDAGGDEKSPPKPFIEVDENTARSLIGTGVAILFAGQVLAIEQAEDAPAAEAGGDESEPAPESRGGGDSGDPAAPDTTPVIGPNDGALPPETAADPNASGDPDGDKGGDEAAAERRQTIAEALELLEAEHFVKTGARAGKPKLSAMEEITGLRDLTVAEIDAVFGAQAAE